MGQPEINGRLQKQARQRGGAIAWIEPASGNKLTYSDVFRAVKRTGARLRTAGVTPGQPVGLLMETRIEFFIALLGVIYSGATAVPLPTPWSHRELQSTTTELELETIITGSEHEETVHSLDASHTVLSMDPPEGPDTVFLDQLKTASKQELPETEDALWLFTSGTTGEPDPVRFTHDNLSSHAQISSEWFDLTAEDLWMAPLPAYHMGGLGPLFRMLHAGGQFLIPPQPLPELIRTFQAFPVSLCSLVPTQLRRLLRHSVTLPLDSLRVLLVGGDRIPPDLAEDTVNAGWPLHGSYGSTETCSHIAVSIPDQYKKQPEDPGAEILPELDISIESGEIVVDGPPVSPGYKNRNRKNKQLFTEEGFHTGDSGEFDSQGRLHVHGRLDQQITTGGETVSPDEVETVLEKHTAVDEAVVVGINDPEWGQAVYAWILAEKSVSEDTLEEYCRKQLASYKIPKHWIFDEIPKTPSGTPDRQKIKQRLTAEYAPSPDAEAAQDGN